MSNKDLQILKQKSAAELQSSLREARAKLRDLQLDLLAGKVKNVGDIRNVRKDIARMLTFLRQAKMQETKTAK